MNYKLIRKSFVGICASLILAGCAPSVECDIVENHVHEYVKDENGLKRYIKGEKEYVGKYLRTDNYVLENKQTDIICDNNLCTVKDNINLLNNIMNQYHNEREAYVYAYIYGTYYGYGNIYNISSGKSELGYGLITGWHWDYEWQEISLDTYTDDKVRDITYKFNFYKIENDGTITSKLFDSLDTLEKDYEYFNENDFVKKIYSDSYYLEKEKSLKKSKNYEVK